MKLKILLINFHLLLAVNLVELETIKDYTGYKVFQINTNNIKDLAHLNYLHGLYNLDIWQRARVPGDQSVVLVSPEYSNYFVQHLNAVNLTHELLIDNVQETIDAERKQREKHKLNFKSYGISFDRYYEYNEIQLYLQQLASQYPQLVKVGSIGKTYEGLEIIGINISTGGKSKPTLLIDGGIHAREWIAPAQALYIINQLVENSTSYQELLDKVDFYIIPVVNPDGYIYTFNYDRFWRKTRSPTSKRKCIGTDANRNFDVHWQSNKFPCSLTYSGSRPFSEVESQALARFAQSLQPNLKFYLNMHSYGEMVLYPYGYTSQQVSNAQELYNLALKFNAVLTNKYSKIGPIYTTIYPASGSTVDWIHENANVDLPYAIELPGGGRYGFDLPPKYIKSVVADTFNGILQFALYVKQKYT